MKSFEIINTRSGHSFGTWEAESAEAALDKYASDAGYVDFADACKAVSGDDIEAHECHYVVKATSSSGQVIDRVYSVDEYTAERKAEELQEKWADVRVEVRELAD